MIIKCALIMETLGNEACQGGCGGRRYCVMQVTDCVVKIVGRFLGRAVAGLDGDTLQFSVVSVPRGNDLVGARSILFKRHVRRCFISGGGRLSGSEAHCSSVPTNSLRVRGF